VKNNNRTAAAATAAAAVLCDDVGAIGGLADCDVMRVDFSAVV